MIRTTLAWFGAATITWIAWTWTRTQHQRRRTTNTDYDRQPYD
jgi:threonine/homoserine/homoserine lactone efflux protein